MAKLRLKKYRVSLIAFIALVFLLAPNFSANASCVLSTSPISNCIQEGATYILFLVFSVVGQMIAALTKGLYYVINIPVYPAGGIAVIDESWKIMRNFANMFFIVALIMMAFATIFNISKYDARTLFPKFLISALLINFSLVLGTLVVDIAQILSNVFLAAIGDMSSRLGESFVQGLRSTLPAQGDISTLAGGGNIEQAVFGSLVQLIFSVILFFTFLFSILTAFIFALIRIPILWALLVVSPLIWILNVFPAGQNLYKKWWSTFIGWNMFLPIFLFFLYFGLYFLQNQGAVMGAIAQQTKDQNIVGFATLQTIFYYVLAAIFLIGGTMTALKASMFGGAGVVGVARWSSGVVAKRIGLTGAQQAWQEKKAEVLSGEGRLGKFFAGPPPGLQTSRRLLGVQGAGDIKPQKEFISKVDKEVASIRDQETAGKIVVDGSFKAAAFKENRNTAKGAAMRAILYERGMLDPSEFDKDMTEWTQKNPFLAKKMSELAKKGKYKKVTGRQLNDMYTAQTGTQWEKYRTAGATASRQEWFSFAMENDETLKDMSVDNLAAGVGLWGGKDSNEGKQKLGAVGKKRADLVAEYKLREDGVTMSATQLSRYIFKEVKNKSPKDLADMLDATWSNPAFQDALRRRAALLQRIQPPVAAIPRGLPGGPRKASPGGGDVFRASLKKSVQNNPRKLGIARTI